MQQKESNEATGKVAQALDTENEIIIRDVKKKLNKRMHQIEFMNKLVFQHCTKVNF